MILNKQVRTRLGKAQEQLAYAQRRMENKNVKNTERADSGLHVVSEETDSKSSNTGSKELQENIEGIEEKKELVNENGSVASNIESERTRTMSKYLCTFTGKFGDILWSLPTAKYIAEKIAGQPVDFAVMPYYQSLLPLLVEQSYIEHAFIKEDWLRTHSNHGDQPWQPPDNIKFLTYAPAEYERMWHLTYRGHPGITAPEMPLVDFIAYQQGISFQGWQVIPFLEVSDSVQEEAAKIHLSSGPMMQAIEEKRLVTYSFNEQYAEQKKVFFETLWAKGSSVGLEFFNVAEVGWKEATWLIKKSLVYVGCRSACWVLANGLGKEIITYEPHPSRHKSCHLGKVFGNPYGQEIALPFGMPPAVAADSAASLLLKMRETELSKV